MRKFVMNLGYIRPSSVQMIHTVPQKNLITNKDENRELMNIWPNLVQDLTMNGRYSDIPDVTKWASKMLNYNVPNKKLINAIDMMHAYKMLVPSNQLTDENLRLARILGWCSELALQFFLMEDDIIDHSITRRGRPCWHLYNDIGLAAVNDVNLLEQMIFELLRIHFNKKPSYLDLLDTFHEAIYKTTIGQLLDMFTTNFGKKPNLNLYTMERYNAIIKYKAAILVGEMPFTLAMNLAEIKENEMFRRARRVFFEMGTFVQIEDDYFDTFEDAQTLGEVSTDIEEGKCSWPIVVALERVNPAQRKILEQCYGENDPEKVARVRQVYDELGLRKIYSVYKEESYNLFKRKIQQISSQVPHELLYRTLNRIYSRDGTNDIHVESTKPQTVTNKDETQEMMILWPDVVTDLTESDSHLNIPDMTKWLKQLLEYNVPGGKMTRASDLVEAYKQIAPPDQLTDENIRLARILAWSNELLQAFFLIEDDIEDNSTTRRGHPCWYLHENIGLSAINDGILLQQMTFQLLRIHFSQHPCYLDLIDTFHENTYRSTLGQTLDMLLTSDIKKQKSLNLFTMDRFDAIAKYKTAYFAFVAPVTLAMHLAGIKNKEMFGQVENIFLDMGNFYQVQNDYLDCYVDPQFTGKIGSDIEEGKCSWLVVVALQRATPAQRKILEECYGVNDPEKVARVRELYDELGLQKIYLAYEEENYDLISTQIKKMTCGLPHDLFFKILNRLHRRIK